MNGNIKTAEEYVSNNYTVDKSVTLHTNPGYRFKFERYDSEKYLN